MCRPRNTKKKRMMHKRSYAFLPYLNFSRLNDVRHRSFRLRRSKLRCEVDVTILLQQRCCISAQMLLHSCVNAEATLRQRIYLVSQSFRDVSASLLCRSANLSFWRSTLFVIADCVLYCVRLSTWRRWFRSSFPSPCRRARTYTRR